MKDVPWFGRVEARVRRRAHVHALLDDVHIESGLAGNQTTSAALWHMSIKAVGGVGWGLDCYSKRGAANAPTCGRAGDIKSGHKQGATLS